jgi:hypothetical protein
VEEDKIQFYPLPTDLLTIKGQKIILSQLKKCQFGFRNFQLFKTRNGPWMSAVAIKPTFSNSEV